MALLSFESDYTEGAHPEILARLAETNFVQASGYGHDEFTESAKEKIRAACGCPDAEVQFVAGGTQANALVISTMLKAFEGVVAAETGHIHTHEAGAVEFTGRKVLTVPQKFGKISADDVEALARAFYGDANREHEVFPGMVYISQPTEYGTLYSRPELRALRDVCSRHGMRLFVDGARLGYGLCSRSADFCLADLAELCDVFYIGGTKVGALCGEAVVFAKRNMPEHFENLVKKHGALLAKGRLLGVQFDALFSPSRGGGASVGGATGSARGVGSNSGDLLYYECARNGIEMAERLKEIFKKKGYEFFLESPTNQQFVILEDNLMEELSKKMRFSFWEKCGDGRTVVRFATSWATSEKNIEILEKLLP